MNIRPGRGPGHRPPRPQRARTAAVITVMAAALLAAACSGSPSSTGSGGSPSAGSSVNSQALAYSRCMRSHGMPNFPDPNGDGQISKEAMLQLGVSGSRFQAAARACQALWPYQAHPLTAPQQQDYLKAAACMRSHGIASFPDPVFSGGGVSFPIPSSIDTNGESFVQARRICVKLIPAGLPYHQSGS